MQSPTKLAPLSGNKRRVPPWCIYLSCYLALSAETPFDPTFTTFGRATSNAMIGYDLPPPPLPKVMSGIKVVLKLARQLGVEVPSLALPSSKETAMRAAEGMRKE